MSTPEHAAKYLKPWAKGQSGNPIGGPRLPPELREARKKNMANLVRLVIQYVGFTDEEAKQRLSGPDTTQLEEMLQGQINRAKEGDSKAFQFLIELTCGKIPETNEGGQPASERLTPEEKLAAAKMMVQVLEREVTDGPGTSESAS